MFGIKIYCRTLFIVFLFGCSSAPKKVIDAPQKPKRPAWLSSPGTYCLNNELCAVGEGTGRLISESNARKELAKIFKVEIKSSTKVSSFSESKTDENQVLSGSVEEDIFSQIQETSHEVLEGVVIKEVFEGEDSIYSLASLDKRKASQILKSRMGQIDEKLKLFVKDGRRHLLSQCIDLLSVREGLNSRYEFLTGFKMRGPVSYKKVFDLKKQKAALGTTIYLKSDEIDKIKSLKDLVKKLLIKNDFKLVDGSQADYTVKVKLVSEQVYMKVDGFVKNKFLLKVHSLDSNKSQIGAISFVVTKTGRDFKQSYEKALPEIKKKIRQKIGELIID